jgi:hypothetical protein
LSIVSMCQLKPLGDSNRALLAETDIAWLSYDATEGAIVFSRGNWAFVKSCALLGTGGKDRERDRIKLNTTSICAFTVICCSYDN